MQHGDLFSSRPALTRAAGQTLSQPFKTFVAPLHNVSKFPFRQRKKQNWRKKKRKKKKSASFLIAIDSRRPRAASGMALDKQAPLALWEMKNGTFRTSVKISVGGGSGVCLLKVAGHWWFVSGDHETPHLSELPHCPPHQQPISRSFLTDSVLQINTPCRPSLRFRRSWF